MDNTETLPFMRDVDPSSFCTLGRFASVFEANDWTISLTPFVLRNVTGNTADS